MEIGRKAPTMTTRLDERRSGTMQRLKIDRRIVAADQCRTVASGIVTGDFESIRGLSGTFALETASR